MQAFNTPELKTIANENDTSKAIFNELSGRQRSHARINIRSLKYDLLTKGTVIEDDKFIDTFKKLMALGIGSLVVGRAGKPTRFIWNYKLRDITGAVNTQPEIKVIAKPGRPKGAPNKKKALTTSPISITFNLSANTRTEDLAALISLAKELESK